MADQRLIGTILFAGALSLGIATQVPAYADHHGGNGHRGDHMARMIERLELDDDQIPLVREILADAGEQRREIRRADRGERRAAMEALRADTESRLAAVLTPAQMQAMTDARSERRNAGMERMRDRRQGAFTAMAEAVDLAESQIAPVREILGRAGEQRRALHQQVRNGELERESVHGQMQTLRAETETELSAVLTPAQMDALRAFNAGRESRRPHRRHGPMGHRGN